MSDVFEELNEDIRRDNMTKLWKKYGPWVIGICVLIVAAVGGSAGYESYKKSQAVSASNAYLAYVEALTVEGDDSALLKAVEDTGHKGYILLSKIAEADTFAKDENFIEAVKLYDIIAFDASNVQNDRDLANIKAAYLLVDTASLDEMKKRLENINVVENAFRFQAREILGLVAYRTEQYKEAHDIFTSLSANAQTPNNIRNRAEQVLLLLASKI